MAYAIIEDWRGGVDRRRPIYASKPGTLYACSNAHVTTGGDIEIRKAFVDRGGFGSDTFGLVSAGDQLYTFGSVDASVVTVPGDVTYVRLYYPGGPMVRFVDHDLFDGAIYVIAEYGDGSVQHFYDGSLVTAWNDGIVRPYMGTLTAMATAMAALIDASATYVATSAGQVITVTAATAGTPFTVSTFAENGGAVDDETLVNANTVANVVGVTAVAASFAFVARGGPGAGSLSSLTVGGVEVLNVGVNWATSNTNFASLIATQINSFASTPEYSATSSGEVVVVSAAVTGTTANGLSVSATTTGTATVGTQTAAGTNNIGTMSGGVAAVSAVAQVNTLTLGGTFDPGDRFGVTLTSGVTVEYFGNVAKPFGNATCVLTHKRKLYAGAGALLFFCKVNDPLLWNSDVDAGAGFITVSNHVGGAEEVGSLTVYQGREAIFSRQAIQLWTMQNDDDLNVPDQFLENSGTRSPRSTLEFAGNDVFYLDDLGIRSIRARDASNNAFASGVGAAINRVVRDWMATGASQDEITGAVVAVEPEEGRFWMVIGSRVYIYSYFPDTGIAAWTWYEPGFVITDLARTTNRVWGRGDDNRLYLYGGNSGYEYGSDYETVVELPFTAAQKDGTFKDFSGMHIAATGTWSCQWRVNPNNLYQVVQMGSYDGFTFNRPQWAGVGHTTHIAPILRHQAAGVVASLSKLALFYQGAEASG